MVADAANAHGMRTTALRYFNAAGADPDGEIGEDHDPETHLIPLVLQAALGGDKPIRVFGSDYPTADGTCIRDYVHVADLAAAHVLALDRLERMPGAATFNLGTGSGISVREIIEASRRLTNRAMVVENVERRPGDPAELVADPARAEAELGWTPRHSDLDTLLATAWEWQQRKGALS
jgi:UDP-glucose 4-epimerase